MLGYLHFSCYLHCPNLQLVTILTTRKCCGCEKPVVLREERGDGNSHLPEVCAIG